MNFILINSKPQTLDSKKVPRLKSQDSKPGFEFWSLVLSIVWDLVLPEC